MYKFTAVHNLVLFAVAFLLHLPFLVEDLSKHAYTVNRNGIVLITGRQAAAPATPPPPPHVFLLPVLC